MFRHYWILAKLLINGVATIVLLMYMQTRDHLAAVAAEMTSSGGDLHGLRSPSPVLHAGAALLLSLVATTEARCFREVSAAANDRPAPVHRRGERMDYQLEDGTVLVTGAGQGIAAAGRW